MSWGWWSHPRLLVHCLSLYLQHYSLVNRNDSLGGLPACSLFLPPICASYLTVYHSEMQLQYTSTPFWIPLISLYISDTVFIPLFCKDLLDMAFTSFFSIIFYSFPQAILGADNKDFLLHGLLCVQFISLFSAPPL